MEENKNNVNLQEERVTPVEYVPSTGAGVGAIDVSGIKLLFQIQLLSLVGSTVLSLIQSSMSRNTMYDPYGGGASGGSTFISLLSLVLGIVVLVFTLKAYTKARPLAEEFGKARKFYVISVIAAVITVVCLAIASVMMAGAMVSGDFSGLLALVLIGCAGLVVVIIASAMSMLYTMDGCAVVADKCLLDNLAYKCRKLKTHIKVGAVAIIISFLLFFVALYKTFASFLADMKFMYTSLGLIGVVAIYYVIVIIIYLVRLHGTYTQAENAAVR